MCRSLTANCTGTIGEQDGNVTDIQVTLVILGADLAENYYTTDDSIKAGDLVSIDTTLPAGAKKSRGPYDSHILGVVSTQPGKILDDAIGRDFGRAIPIALVGRVPVTVSTENGPIYPGDLLTSSSIPGVAMRATKAGYVIGRALTGFESEGDGVVLAFVNTHYANQNPIDTSQLDALLRSIELDSKNNFVATISANTKFIWKNGAGDIVAWVSDTGSAFFESIDTAVASIGKLIIRDEITIAQEAQISGTAIIKIGQSEITIDSDKIQENSQIHITPTTKTEGYSLYIKEIVPGEGFKVALDWSSKVDYLLWGQSKDPSSEESIQFNWLIINQE